MTPGYGTKCGVFKEGKKKPFLEIEMLDMC